jgi:HSP20 family protein
MFLIPARYHNHNSTTSFLGIAVNKKESNLQNHGSFPTTDRKTIQKEFEMTYFIAPNPYQIAQRWARMAGYEPSRDLGLAVDVREEDDAYILNALVPGLKADDLNVQIMEDVVTIAGEFKDDESEDGKSEYLMRELPYGSFSRTLRLPVTLDAGKAEAKITDGVLTLRLAKAESALPKTIKVAVK